MTIFPLKLFSDSLAMTVQIGVACLALLGLTSALICPDGGMCAEGNTCCKTPSGGYGCCPLPNAECCSDHLHCCYEGTVCDLVHSKCLNKTVSLPWVRRVPAKRLIGPLMLEGVKAVICPDGEAECPDDTTCCELPGGSWGCCPMAKAVCCEDKMHCCPEGTKCDLAHSKCVSPTLDTFPMREKVPARKRQTAVVGQAVTCPGGKSLCPDGTTCCLLASGDFGCCPYPEGVCCTDKLHCCPGNTTCDLEHEMCTSPNTRTPLAKKISAIPNDVDCPDKLSLCPDDTTCCLKGNGSYGCCPMPSAVCCSDHLHCCPEGTTCDLGQGTCVSKHDQTPMAVKIPATLTTSSLQSRGPRQINAVPCNDSVACADGSTCCKSLDGEWVCCPLPKAVCCDDHLHCCPHGTICNLAESTCDDPSGSALVPILDKVPAFSYVSEEEPLPNSKCDESTSCPGQSTCCKTTTGNWACYPLPNAMCCNDHLHCCPHGTVCNLEASTCDDPSGFTMPWVTKVPALPTQTPLATEKCDEQTMCPRGTTCCRQNSGQSACCPLPHAVCCDDHEHCCPKGYTCNVAEQTCDKPGLLSRPWVPKLPGLPLHRGLPQASAPSVHSAKNMCDPHTSCPKDTTCCFVKKTGKWGCCPLPKAVCCADGDHCCPSGYSCDDQKTCCTKGRLTIPWYRKKKALTVGAMLKDVKCDNNSSCASGTTCCKLPTGEWGCCPLVKAVCCTDHEHCCPQGYSCNMQTGTCEKPVEGVLPHMIPQTKVAESQQRAAEAGIDVKCDGAGEYSCPKLQTCCKTSATEWSCCPEPKAVCCADAKHCCPMGYTCHLGQGGCSQQAELTWDIFFTHNKKRDFVPFGL
ncbi:progranulin-like isoform X2 [Salvelinus fontinalis]|uniref:progranulin-like isoform X2 n=1 Tax=Salvelinus fontinalis TaxID=8038 RepID=UPI002485F6B8|nr:progranulin-like isoform X2 [Salvelinus fontinalis]